MAGNGDRAREARDLLDKIAKLGEELEQTFVALARLYPGLHLADLGVAMQGQRHRLTDLARKKMEVEEQLLKVEFPEPRPTDD